MPKYHDNQLILLTDAEWGEISAEVKQAPEMESVYRLGALLDQHRAEAATADKLWGNINSEKQKALAMEKRAKQAQATHDRLGDILRLSEERIAKQELEAKGIEEEREIHGRFTNKLVRDRAIAKLRAHPDFIAKSEELAALQKEMEGLAGEISKIVKKMPKLEREAQAQSLKAGDILKEIRQLEAELDAASR